MWLNPRMRYRDAFEETSITSDKVRMDFNKGFDLGDVVLVNDEARLTRMTMEIEDAGYISFDLETTGLDEHATTGGESNGGVAARVVLMSVTLTGRHFQTGDYLNPTDHDIEKIPFKTYVLPLAHPDSPWRGHWVDVLTHVAEYLQESGALIGHNVKFDARYIYATTGVDLSKNLFWDTAQSASLLDENNSKALKEVVPRIFGVQRWDDVDLKTPGAADREPLLKLADYAARDTYWTHRLFFHHFDEMGMSECLEDYHLGVYRYEDERNLADVMYHITMPSVRTMTQVEQRGLGFDRTWVYGELEAQESRAEEAQAELVDKYPDEKYPEREPLADNPVSLAPTSKWFKEWVDRAVIAGDLRVAALTPSGKPQWNAAVLKKQARLGSEVAQNLVDYRDALKRTEFLKSWLTFETPEHRIHATYNLGNTVTGRLSSSNPNMQQVNKKLKPAFIPSEGHYLAEIDYSQIELRVAAFVSGCHPMIRAFQNGDDLHTLLASRINGVPPEEVTPDMRKGAKAGNFGLLYGMSAGGFKNYAETVYGVEMSEEEAVQVRRLFFDMWTGLEKWHDRARFTVRTEGEVVAPHGRIRRLSHKVFSGNPALEAEGERNAINSPVQGMASDIMQSAAALIAGNMPGLESYAVPDAKIVGTVHDSIMVEVPIESWEETTRQCKHVMEKAVPLVLRRLGVSFNVPLVADAEVGTRYGLSDVGVL